MLSKFTETIFNCFMLCNVYVLYVYNEKSLLYFTLWPLILCIRHKEVDLWALYSIYVPMHLKTINQSFLNKISSIAINLYSLNWIKSLIELNWELVNQSQIESEHLNEYSLLYSLVNCGIYHGQFWSVTLGAADWWSAIPWDWRFGCGLRSCHEQVDSSHPLHLPWSLCTIARR